MKTPTNIGGNNLVTWLQSATEMRMADLYTITLKSGTVLRYTTWEQSLTVLGNKFVTGPPSIERTAIEEKIGLDVATIEVIIRASRTPPPGWLVPPSGTISYETSSPAPGKLQSLKYVSAGQFIPVGNQNRYSVVPGEAYSISCAVKSDGVGIPACFLQFYNDAFISTGNITAAGTTSTSWATVTGIGAVPANTVMAQIFVQNSASTQPSAVWFDQLSVQKTSFKALTLSRWSISSIASPSCSATSGFGTAPACAVSNNCSDSLCRFVVTTGTSPGSSGTVTFNFSSSFGSTAGICLAQPNNDVSAWSPRASLIQNNVSQTSAAFNWDNNGVSLNGSAGYTITVMCGGR